MVDLVAPRYANQENDDDGDGDEVADVAEIEMEEDNDEDEEEDLDTWRIWTLCRCYHVNYIYMRNTNGQVVQGVLNMSHDLITLSREAIQTNIPIYCCVSKSQRPSNSQEIFIFVLRHNATSNQ